MYRWALLALISIAAVDRPLGAQVRTDPGTVINGKVAVKVAVTLSDDETPYAPLSNLQLRFFRSATDSVVVRTDDAGVVTTLLSPGDYRLVSGSPTEWKGTRYTWSIPLTVRAGMALVDLKATYADRQAPVASAPVPTRVAAALPNAPVVIAPTATTSNQQAQPAASRSTYLTPKDGTTATLFSFLLTGGGQMYAGEPGKGLVFLGLGLGGAALAVSAASNIATCDYSGYGGYDCVEPDYGLVYVGLGIAAFSWIASMVDASRAAHRYNVKHGISTADITPVMGPARNGQTRLGLSLAIGR
jgi:hypothetical protein